MDTRLAEPSTVGEILSEEFLKPMGITQDDLTKTMGITRKVISQIINNKRRISIEEAVKLSTLFQTEYDFWLNLQASHDRWEARQMAAKLENRLSITECLRELHAT